MSPLIPGNPEATIRKMDVVIRAALAPSEPSPQDFAVARAAQQARAQAQRELQEQRQAEQEENGGTDSVNLALNPNQNAQDSDQNVTNNGNIRSILQIYEAVDSINENRRGIQLNAIN